MWQKCLGSEQIRGLPKHCQSSPSVFKHVQTCLSMLSLPKYENLFSSISKHAPACLTMSKLESERAMTGFSSLVGFIKLLITSKREKNKKKKKKKSKKTLTTGSNPGPAEIHQLTNSITSPEIDCTFICNYTKYSITNWRSCITWAGSKMRCI